MWLVGITDSKVKGCVICEAHMNNKASTNGNILVTHNTLDVTS